MLIKRRILPINHWQGRRGCEVLGVAIHIMEGSMESTWDWFNNPASQVSAHYGVSRHGDIVQYVDEDDGAWHAGRVQDPTAQIVLDHPGVNPNCYLIGIENEGYAGDGLSASQQAANAWLLADISKRRPKVKLDRYHVVRHHEIFAPKSCPGAVDVDALVRLARQVYRPAPQPGDRVWSPYERSFLVVTRYVSDGEWYFVREDALRLLGRRAKTPFSLMPKEP